MKKKISINVEFVRIGTDEEAEAAIRSAIKYIMLDCLDKHGTVAHNHDEVLDKYITVESGGT
ncbi:hypothetical protein ACK8P5_16640 [Paenibacillus sp. EC2-1]|uniref:hypothetical protein n=1 Tax=Paenibacillus sp. EC2-1 TaxID=3388665 RepID=UPI003BEF4416